MQNRELGEASNVGKECRYNLHMKRASLTSLIQAVLLHEAENIYTCKPAVNRYVLFVVRTLYQNISFCHVYRWRDNCGKIVPKLSPDDWDRRLRWGVGQVEHDACIQLSRLQVGNELCTTNNN